MKQSHHSQVTQDLVTHLFRRIEKKRSRVFRLTTEEDQILTLFFYPSYSIGRKKSGKFKLFKNLPRVTHYLASYGCVQLERKGS